MHYLPSSLCLSSLKFFRLEQVFTTLSITGSHFNFFDHIINSSHMDCDDSTQTAHNTQQLLENPNIEIPDEFLDSKQSLTVRFSTTAFPQLLHSYHLLLKLQLLLYRCFPIFIPSFRTPCKHTQPQH